MKITYTFPCTKNSLSEVRQKVAMQLSQSGISETTRNRIVLAIDEACANAIIHGHRCDGNRQISMDVAIKGNQMQVDIYDVGKIAPPARRVGSTRPDINAYVESRRCGGLGLPLIHSIMDQVQYHIRGNQTICSLRKTLR